MVPVQLKISVSGNVSVEVYHVVLPFESKIGHITGYAESEDPGCQSLDYSS